MKTSGSATYDESIEQAGYRLELRKGSQYILRNLETGKLETWQRRTTPISGYQIKHKKGWLEFCGETQLIEMKG